MYHSKTVILKYISTFIALLLISQLNAQIPTGYYNGTENLMGNELKTVLYTIIKGHTEFPYTASGETDVWDILKETDQDTVNTDNVILLYTGWTLNGALEYNNAQGWSREHVWAKSHGDFGTAEGPGTDVHALRPCDISVNSARSNLDFAEGGKIYVDADGATTCKYTSDSWEPRDEVKGDVARMIFYMATRYEGENGEPDLKIVDYVNSSPNFQPLHGKLSDLLKWNKEDTVSTWEIRRNNIIFEKYQHNRNPFIDHPEFAEKIWQNLVSIDNQEFTTKISIFPNPAHNQIHIFIMLPYPQLKNAQIELLDLFGKSVKNIIPDSSFTSIPCSDLSKGIYILRLQLSNTVVHKKVIIN